MACRPVPYPAVGARARRASARLAHMSDEVVYSWRDAVTDDEVAELIDSHGGRSEARWWDQIRPHSLGWVTARTAVLDPTVDLLADLARGGPALAFAVGTGRVALPLHERGLEVHRIELSPPMVDQLRQKPG